MEQPNAYVAMYNNEAVRRVNQQAVWNDALSVACACVAVKFNSGLGVFAWYVRSDLKTAEFSAAGTTDQVKMPTTADAARTCYCATPYPHLTMSYSFL